MFDELSLSTQQKINQKVTTLDGEQTEQNKTKLCE